MHTATKGHVWLYGPIVPRVCVDFHGPCWHQRSVVCITMSWRCQRSMLQPEAMLLCQGYVASGGHIDVSGVHCHLRLCWCPWSMLIPKVYDLWYNVMQMLVVCARAMLPMGIILMWVAFTATWDYANVHSPGCLKGLVCVCGPIAIGGHVCSLCCCQKPWGSPWCVVPLMTKSKEATFEVISVHSWKRETWKASVTMPTLTPTPLPKTNSLNRKPLKGTLKKCNKNDEVSSAQLMASGGGYGRRTIGSI